MRSASARAVVLAAVAALAAAVPAGGAALGSARRPAAAEPPRWLGGTYRASSGEPVTVWISATYPPEQVAPQKWVEFFSGLPHGGELSSLVARVATPAEVETLCGGAALGCYESSELVVPGETSGGEAPEEVARHEYGHHIAANRANPPWRAGAWGPKRWAAATNVCRRSEEQTAFPGDDGSHYQLDPAEAFAETYRVLADQRAGAALFTWGLIDWSFYPGEATLRAVEDDVAKPWTRPTVSRWNGRFTAGGPRLRVIPVATPLDGDLTATLRLPPGRLDTLELLSPDGRVIARGLWSGARSRRIRFVVCGHRRLSVRVRSDGTVGHFELTVSRP